MYQGLRLSRLGLALVVLAFCLPLFVGLGQADLETSEAGYSFAVDRIIESGGWLEPKSSPSDTAVFLEQPPLKFWMVAAPIKAGLLPHNEFGLRFVDAVEGSVAFAYVFAIGSLLAGPVCGAVAVLLLFIHGPLVFAHGLRTNTMEASLILSYSAGVFHFLRWSALDGVKARRRHILWAGLFFVLGFMTKFAAALFLPFTLGLAALAVPRVRARLIEDGRAWLAVAAVVVAVCAPWFIYANIRFGSLLWETILGEHVRRQMTGPLDPAHLHPWNFYVRQMWQEFVNQRMQWVMAAGFLVLLAQSVRRRWFEGTVVLMWAVLPMAIISGGTSKLYQYAYPYLPPLALAAGYLVALVVMLAPAPLRRVLEWFEDRLAAIVPGLAEPATGPTPQALAWLVIASASVLAVVVEALGGLHVSLGGTVIKSSGVMPPVALIIALGLLTRTSARVGRLVVMLVVFSALPLAAYRSQFGRLPDGKHPIRTTAECILRVQGESGTNAGILIDVPGNIRHPLYYYFRGVHPVTLSPTPLDPSIDRYLTEPASARPILISEPVWREFVARRRQSGTTDPSVLSPPMERFPDTLLLLPGPYSACSPADVVLNRG